MRVSQRANDFLAKLMGKKQQVLTNDDEVVEKDVDDRASEADSDAGLPLGKEANCSEETNLEVAKPTEEEDRAEKLVTKEEDAGHVFEAGDDAGPLLTKEACHSEWWNDVLATGKAAPYRRPRRSPPQPRPTALQIATKAIYDSGNDLAHVIKEVKVGQTCRYVVLRD
jgi:hypothetical protein